MKESLPPIAGIRTGIYRHCKGGLYQVTGTALHSETLEELVVYKHLREDGTPDPAQDHSWVRPRAMFLEEVEMDGRRVPRFEYLRDA